MNDYRKKLFVRGNIIKNMISGPVYIVVGERLVLLEGLVFRSTLLLQTFVIDVKVGTSNAFDQDGDMIL